MIPFETQRRSRTEYVIGLGAISNGLRPFTASPVALVVDREAWRHHGPTIREALPPADELQVVTVDGETDKNLNTIQRLAGALFESRFDRRGTLLGVGGGAVCDITGFLAMVYMRGIEYSLIATSSMAQLDAAIGGKVGCNFATRKNALGGFHHPERVILDPQFLRSLPQRELRAGFSEAVKLDMIVPEYRIGDLMSEVDRQHPETAAMADLITACVDAKLSLIAADPFESNLDRVLNLGHAVAHALEMTEPGTLLHGEAVSVGLASTARYAAHKGLCPWSRATSITKRLQGLSLPTSWLADHRELLNRLSEIADHRGGHMRLVVPAGEVGVEILQHAELDLLTASVTGEV